MVVLAVTRWPGIMPLNFSAVYAFVFCAGVFFPGRMAWWLPLSTLLATDVVLNLFYYHVPVLNGYLLVNYLVYAALILLGKQFKPKSSWVKLLSGGLMGAVLFYVVTNTFAWIYEPTQPYPKTLAGWIQALTVGTSGWPETWKFFRNTLLSGGLFTGLFVGAMRLAERREPDSEEEEEEKAAAAGEAVTDKGT
jgi:hypothetical protein